MSWPKVYIDTTVLKFSATQLPRLLPRKQTIDWGGRVHEVTVHDFVRVNPNDSIDNPELKAETELLPTLAEAGKRGEVKYVIQMETLFESWGIPKMDSDLTVMEERCNSLSYLPLEMLAFWNFKR
jgi:hypothetical protein